MLKLGDKFVLTGKSNLNFSMVWKSCSRIPLIYVEAWMSKTLPKLTFSVPNLVKIPEVDLVFLTRITIDLKGGGGGGIFLFFFFLLLPLEREENVSKIWCTTFHSKLFLSSYFVS